MSDDFNSKSQDPPTFDREVAEDQALQELKLTSGRINDYSIENFLFSFWLNFSVGIVMVLIFQCYRRLRGDQQTLENKLHEKAMQSRGIKDENNTNRVSRMPTEVQSPFDQTRSRSNTVGAPGSPGLRPSTNSIRGTHFSKTTEYLPSESSEAPQDQTQEKVVIEEHLQELIGQNIKDINFVGLLQIIDETQLIRLMGRDLNLYLKFLKFQAGMFFTIFLFNFTFLTPLFYSGNDADKYLLELADSDPSDTTQQDSAAQPSQEEKTELGLTAKDTGYNMIMFTILNVQSDNTKMAIAYCFVMLTSIIVYIQIFKFWRETYVWKHMNFEHKNNAAFSNLHKYCLLVRGIPKSLEPEESSKQVERIIQRTYQDRLIAFKLVGDYTVLNALGDQFKQKIDQISTSVERERLLEVLLNYQEQGNEDLKDVEKESKQLKKNTNPITSCVSFLCCDKPMNTDRAIVNTDFCTCGENLQRTSHLTTLDKDIWERTTDQQKGQVMAGVRDSMDHWGQVKRRVSTSQSGDHKLASNAATDLLRQSINAPNTVNRRTTLSSFYDKHGMSNLCNYCQRQEALKKKDDITAARKLIGKFQSAESALTKQKKVTDKFNQELIEMCKDITLACKKWKNSNLGCAFMMLDNANLVKRLKHGFPQKGSVYKRFLKLCCCARPPKGTFEHTGDQAPVAATPYERHKLQMDNWTMESALLENDILWDEINYSKADSFICESIINVILFVLSVVVLTPVFLFQIVSPISDEIQANSEEDSIMREFGEMLELFWSPILIALVNVLLIPTVVDIVAKLMYKETKSEFQEITLFHNFVYMGLNMILLPMTGLITIKEFVETAAEKELGLLEHIASNLGDTAAFFVTYLMQVTFISNCIQMFDIPHFLFKSTKGFLLRKQLKKYTDDWFFEIGYYQAYTATIGTMCLMFSVTMPIVTAFAACFFFFRFYIEKYNMLFVYQQEFESKDTIRSSIVTYQIIAVTLYQLFNYAFIQTSTGSTFYANIGYAVIVIQLALVYLVTKIHQFDDTFFMPPVEEHQEEFKGGLIDTGKDPKGRTQFDIEELQAAEDQQIFKTNLLMKTLQIEKASEQDSKFHTTQEVKPDQDFNDRLSSIESEEFESDGIDENIQRHSLKKSERQRQDQMEEIKEEQQESSPQKTDEYSPRLFKSKSAFTPVNKKESKTVQAGIAKTRSYTEKRLIKALGVNEKNDVKSQARRNSGVSFFLNRRKEIQREYRELKRREKLKQEVIEELRQMYEHPWIKTKKQIQAFLSALNVKSGPFYELDRALKSKGIQGYRYSQMPSQEDMVKVARAVTSRDQSRSKQSDLVATVTVSNDVSMNKGSMYEASESFTHSDISKVSFSNSAIPSQYSSRRKLKSQSNSRIQSRRSSLQNTSKPLDNQSEQEVPKSKFAEKEGTVPSHGGISAGKIEEVFFDNIKQQRREELTTGTDFAGPSVKKAVQKSRLNSQGDDDQAVSVEDISIEIGAQPNQYEANAKEQSSLKLDNTPKDAEEGSLSAIRHEQSVSEKPRTLVTSEVKQNAVRSVEDKEDEEVKE